MPINEIVSVVKTLVDLGRGLRDEYDRRKPLPPITTGSLIELYGILVKLEALLPDFAVSLNQNEDGLRHWHDTSRRECFELIDRVLAIVRTLNLELIELYMPGFRERVERAHDLDRISVSHYRNQIAPSIGAGIDTLPSTLREFVKAYDLENGIWHSSAWTILRLGSESLADTVNGLLAVCSELRAIVGEILKTNWTLKDLTT